MRARSAASRVLELDMTTGMPAVRGSAQLLQHCESARGRHEQVEQDEVRLFVAGKSEAFDSVGGLDDLGALPREQLPQQVARDFLVVDEQHLAQRFAAGERMQPVEEPAAFHRLSGKRIGAQREGLFARLPRR